MFTMVKELFIVLALISNIYADLILQQAVVISRHGSRTLLTKDHKTFQEGADSQLTVRGMDQMFGAGTYVQRRYRNASFLTDVYSPQDIYVRSSDYSRTLNSALSFLLGLYPPRNQTLNVSYAGVFRAPYNIQQVPIHTVAAEDDQVLRGWLACSELHKRLAKFYKSSEFQKKESESAELRKQLENIMGIGKIELKDFYNVYDYIHLHRLYNHTYNLNITEEQWTKVVYLADWVEYNKYSKEIIGDIGGGLLANEIASSFSKVVAKQSKTKLLYYSAHYPTMFSLFSALGLNNVADSPLRRIPYYASLVVVELLRDSKNADKSIVQFSFKNGLEEPLTKYSIPGCQDPCSLDQFVDLVKLLEVRDVASWCHACSNTQLSRCQLAPQPVCPSVKEPAVSGTGGFFLGVFVTLLLVIFVTALWHFCLSKRCLPAGDIRRPTRGLADLENVPATGVI